MVCVWFVGMDAMGWEDARLVRRSRLRLTSGGGCGGCAKLVDVVAVLPRLLI